MNGAVAQNKWDMWVLDSLSQQVCEDHKSRGFCCCVLVSLICVMLFAALLFIAACLMERMLLNVVLS